MVNVHIECALVECGHIECVALVRIFNRFNRLNVGKNGTGPCAQREVDRVEDQRACLMNFISGDQAVVIKQWLAEREREKEREHFLDV